MNFAQSCTFLITTSFSLLPLHADSPLDTIDDVTIPTMQFRMSGHKQGVRSVAFSADGKLLGAACHDGFVRVWRTRDWLPVLRKRLDAIDVAFSPDGRSMGVISTFENFFERQECRIDVFSLPDGKQKCSIDSKLGTVTFRKLLFSPDSQVLAVLTERHGVVLRDAESGKLRVQLDKAKGFYRDFCFSPVNNQIGFSCGNWLYVWDWMLDKQVERYKFVSMNLSRILFSADGKLLLGVNDNNALRVLDTRTNEICLDLPRQFRRGPVSFNGDGTGIVEFGPRVVNEWRFGESRLRKITGKRLRAGEHFQPTARPACLSPDGRLLVVPHKAEVWNILGL